MRLLLLLPCPVSLDLVRLHLGDLRRARSGETPFSWCLTEVGPRWPFSRWRLTQSGLPSGDSAGIEGLHSRLTNLTASVGRRCPSRPRRPGLESVHGLLPRRERLEDKGGAARLLVVEERRAPQLIVLGNRVVLEDVAPAARPPTMLRVTSSHHPRRMSPTAAAAAVGGGQLAGGSWTRQVNITKVINHSYGGVARRPVLGTVAALHGCRSGKPGRHATLPACWPGRTDVRARSES
jgi:hypothetical protein